MPQMSEIFQYLSFGWMNLTFTCCFFRSMYIDLFETIRAYMFGIQNLWFRNVFGKMSNSLTYCYPYSKTFLCMMKYEWINVVSVQRRFPTECLHYYTYHYAFRACCRHGFRVHMLSFILGLRLTGYIASSKLSMVHVHSRSVLKVNFYIFNWFIWEVF